MGKALDFTSWTATAPSSGAAMAAVATDPAAVRNATPGSMVRLVAAWCKAQAVGFSQIVYPSGNDTTRNFRWENVANQPGNMVPKGLWLPMKAQDALTLTQAGSAVAGDVELVHLGMYYDDLPGIDQQLIDRSELAARFVRMVTVQGTLTPTIASTYSGALALSGFTQFLRGNTQYAWIGAKMSAAAGMITMKGPATGNLHVGIPGLLVPDEQMVNWFANLGDTLGVPCIPTFNTADLAGTFMELVQDENLTAQVFNMFLVELS